MRREINPPWRKAPFNIWSASNQGTKRREAEEVEGILIEDPEETDASSWYEYHPACADPARPPSHQTTDVPAPEEPLPCYHCSEDANGVRFKRKSDLTYLCWDGNRITDADRVVQFLDSTLMQGNMMGWVDMQVRLRAYSQHFEMYYMSTGSKHRGFFLCCKACSQFVKIAWEKKDDWLSPRLEECRRLLKAYLVQGPTELDRQPIV